MSARLMSARDALRMCSSLRARAAHAHVPARPFRNGFAKTSLPNTSAVTSSNVTFNVVGFFATPSATARSFNRAGPNVTMFAYVLPEPGFLGSASASNICVTAPTNGPIFPLLLP